MIPVAIVGGGPVGLTTSILLSLQGIQNTVYERYPSTSIHPKACGLNQRTLEIFRKLGIEDEVMKASAPKERSGRTAWYTTLGKEGKEIWAADAWGGGTCEKEYRESSPSSYAICPQIRLEPILKRRAIELNAEGIKYRSEVLDIVEREDHIALSIKQTEEDGTIKEYEEQAAYALICDGGRNFTEALGFKWEGETNIVDMVTAHLRAPLSQHHPDPRNFITWFINPDMGGSIASGYLYHVGPYPTNPGTEEWVFAFAMRPDDPQRFDKDEVMKRLKRSIDVPELNVDILSLSHWYVNSVVADKYRTDGGRIFLVGDAAHRVPPWGALGLNTGIQDAWNLAWKLALALTRKNGQRTMNSLLNTYDQERRPIARRVADSSLHNLKSHALIMDAALGVSVDKTAEENRKALEVFFDENSEGHEAKREAVGKAQELLDSEFKAPGIEIGWFYPSVDTKQEGLETRHDGQLLDNGELSVSEYHPSTIPGHSLPHVWLSKEGKTVSTRDLVEKDKFLLLAWTGEYSPTHSLDLVHTEVIGGSSGWTDVEGSWSNLSGVGAKGAVLVRPDGIVAWRKSNFEYGDAERLPELLQKLLETE